MAKDQFNTPFASTMATYGHWNFPFVINGDEYDFQISSYGAKATLYGVECDDACRVPKQFDHGERPWVGEIVLNYFKNFDVIGVENGFI